MRTKYESTVRALRAAAQALAQNGVEVTDSATEDTTRLRFESPSHLAEVVVWLHGWINITVVDLASNAFVYDGTNAIKIDPPSSDELMTRLFQYFGVSWDQFAPR
jgi:hypothetical protein